MDLSGSYFEYNGTTSRKYGLIFAHADTEEFNKLNGEIESGVIFNKKGKRNYFVGESFEDSPLKFEAEIITDNDEVINRFMRREIEKWLFHQRDYCKLYTDMDCDTYGEAYELVDGMQKRLYLNCRFVNPEKIESGSGLIGYRFTIECDSCMAWQDAVTYEYSFVNRVSSGSLISINDSIKAPLNSIKVFGKTTQNDIPTPEAPVPLESVGNGGSITVKVGTSETDEQPQTLTISTPNGLPGIPVTSGGNYTDGTGQQWVCDEIDFARGKYIQRVATIEYDGSSDETWNVVGTPVARHIISGITPAPKPAVNEVSKAIMICSHFEITSYSELRTATINSIAFNSATSYTTLGIVHQNYKSETDTAAFRAWLSENPVTVMYAIATPVETDLSTEELTAFTALRTNYPSTTIFNDGGAGMEVKYCTSTTITVNVDTDLRDYVYPKVTIQTGTFGGDIQIINFTDDNTRATSFVSLSPNITLTMRGDGINYISGDYYQRFSNKNFIRLLDGENEINITGDVAKITFEFQNRRYL